ncbi:S-layer homology domain-containing protein [Intestinimonas sp. MSJ-38]|uniref:S-layer homology domain-containing protein n=1 Tax=Intestinimonas sp. MSJ-38 TaxID=2841532 RepID=UPI001C0FE41A|nr:S-layer homology domain-containing protein [Intestinimonas sp. MSJ-38]MBU5433018.1 S-layer homology domain-containing protein [Intestinimonas sp. MSJ-38]
MKQSAWNRALSLVMSVVMLVSLLCVPALADNEGAEAPTEPEVQDITQTGLDLTTPPTEETTYRAGEGTITFTPASEGVPGIITFNNAALIGAGKDVDYKTAILFPVQGEYNVVLNGQNTISGFYKVSTNASGAGNLKVTFSGDGQLAVSDCNFFINSWEEIVFDGANITSDTEYGSIVISKNVQIINGSKVKLYVRYDESDDYSNIMAGNVEIFNSNVTMETGSDCGIYNYLGTNGIKIIGSTVNIVAGSNGYAGLLSNNSGDIVIDNSNVNISGSGRGIWANKNNVEILGNSTVQITADAHGIRLDNGTVKFAGTSTTTIHSESNGLRVKNSPMIKDKASVEITANSHVCEAQNSDGEAVYAVSPDFSEYDAFGYTAVSNTEAAAAGASAWDGTTGLDRYKYFKVGPTLPLNVTFDLGYDGVAPDKQILKAGDEVTAPDTPVREGYLFTGWYSDADFKIAWNFGTDTVTEDMTLYAKWISADAAAYTVSGAVKGNDGENLSGAIVKLMQGDSIVASVTTDADGAFTFANLSAGNYNISAEKDNRGVTNEIVVSNDTNDVILHLPAGNIKTEVKVNENTPSATVSGLDALAEVYAPTNTDVVRIVLNVAGKEETALPEETVSAIKNLSGSETLSYLDMDIERYVNGTKVENITDTGDHVQSITIDFDTARKNISVYRVHDGTAAKLTAAGSTPADGTYRVNDNSITIYATKFSTYAIGYTTKSSGGHSSSSGSATTYPVDVKSVTNGTIKADKSSAAKDSTVTITVTPDKGYELGKLTVTDKNGKTISVTAKGNGQYTFTMPASGVTVTASFVETDWNLAYRNCPKDSTCPIWPFTDAKTTDWYHDGVHFCLENGLMVGYGNNIFQPDAGTTRAMIAVMLWRLNGSPIVNYAMNFEDVKADAWYTEAIRWAASEGVAAGYGNGKFGPDDAMTREQMVTILWRYAQYKGYDVSVGEDTNILSYDDATTVAQYAIPAMQWACGSGMVAGKTQGSGMILDPKGSTTRAQMATMMMRFCAEIVK